MKTENFLLNLGKNWKNIAIISFLVVLITAVFTFAQPLKYRSTGKLLVVQEYNAEVDPYAASRSTQYLSNILVKVVQSSSFFEEVMKAGFNVEDSFGSTEEKRQKNWAKTVNASAISDSGIIVVNVYHRDPEQADQISRAVNFVLKSKNSLYHGWGDRVSIRTIERPLASKYPVSPNVPLNFAFSILFGLILGAGFVYLFPDVKLLGGSKKSKIIKPEENFSKAEEPEEESEKYQAPLEKTSLSEAHDRLYSRERGLDEMILNNYNHYSEPKKEKKEMAEKRVEKKADDYSVDSLMAPKESPAGINHIDEEPNFNDSQDHQEDLDKYREILPREDESVDFEDGDMSQFVGKVNDN